jgi:hypothetical protein
MRGLALLLLLIPTTCFAQISVGTNYAAHEPIVASMPPPPEGIGQNVIWEINEPAKWMEFNGNVAIWAPAGNYRITATVLQTRKVKIGEEIIEVLVPGSFSRYNASFTIGSPAPGPKPPLPTPGGCDDVPDDAYGNLGKKVCGWVGDIPATSQGVRGQLGAVYREAAKRLEQGTFINITEAGTYIATERSKILTGQLDTEWKPFGVKLTEAMSNYRSVDRMQLIGIYRAIGAGLK